MAGESPAVILYNEAGDRVGVWGERIIVNSVPHDDSQVPLGVPANPMAVNQVGFSGQERQEFTSSSYVVIDHTLDGYPLDVHVLVQPPGGGRGAFGVGGFGEGGFGEAGGEPNNYLQELLRGFSLRFVDEARFIVALDAIHTGVILYGV